MEEVQRRREGKKFKGLLVEKMGLPCILNAGDFTPSIGWNDELTGLDAKAELVVRKFRKFLGQLVYELRKMKEKSIGSGGEEGATSWTFCWRLSRMRAMVLLSLREHQSTHLVVKENLRFSRQSTQDISIRDYDITTGTTVILNAWTIGRNPGTWDEPGKFKPNRFLNSPGGSRKQHFKWIPIGAGRRACAGMSLAMATYERVLANLVNTFYWAPPTGLKLEDLDMIECAGLTIHRKVRLLAVATSCPS
ncbi:cytochrome P450 71A2-like [Eucalyptus grandis]|uniref:cytochrome P450 71A2-like n=1 Tax=Eucalyptus grandis TaxID=71139 RepID=UPI00192F0F1F|nr:cytochrome P450 71A2-like [Eucalyptus grandis]